MAGYTRESQARGFWKIQDVNSVNVELILPANL